MNRILITWHITGSFLAASLALYRGEMCAYWAIIGLAFGIESIMRAFDSILPMTPPHL